MEQYFVLLLQALLYQAIGVAMFLPLELAFPRAKITFRERADGLIFLIAVAPLTALVGCGLLALKSALAIKPLLVFNFTLGPVVASIALALYADFQFYVVHRIEHRFFWRFHAVHHSIRNLSAANSFHHWTEPLFAVTIAIPLLFVEVSVGPTLALLTVILTHQQFFIHSSCRPHLGPLRWLLVDNVYHRIHHSTDPAHRDRNFGAMTPLWDWLFGTLYMPANDEWPEVGLADLDEPTSLQSWAAAPWRLRRHGHGHIGGSPNEPGLTPLNRPVGPVV